MSITDGLRKGDIVTHSRTMKIEFAEDGYIQLVDTENPTVKIGLFDGHKGSDKIEVVKKAKPSVGTVLTGNEVADMDWKPGTVLRGETSGRAYLFTKSGLVSGDGGKWPVNCFGSTNKFTVLHVA